MDKLKLIKKWEIEGYKFSEKIIQAFLDIPREMFVLEEHQKYAYDDVPLPILAGQTISQPKTVMIMTEYLDVNEQDKILEIGSGSGYQAAILAKIAKKGKIISVETIKELAEFAKENLIKTKIHNVKILNIDGSKGYQQEAPYDRIIVTCAAPEIPNELFEQLKEGGVMIIPVGRGIQQMQRIRKTDGKMSIETIGEFLFVPMVSK